MNTAMVELEVFRLREAFRPDGCMVPGNAVHRWAPLLGWTSTISPRDSKPVKIRGAGWPGLMQPLYPGHVLTAEVVAMHHNGWPVQSKKSWEKMRHWAASIQYAQEGPEAGKLIRAFGETPAAAVDECIANGKEVVRSAQ